MKIRTLTALTAFALMGYGLPAQADMHEKASGDIFKTVQMEQPSSDMPKTQKSEPGTQKSERGEKKAQRSDTDTTEEAKADEAANGKIKAAMIEGQDTAEQIPMITIDSWQTAKNMIGRQVYNSAGESVGRVDDITLDQQGVAQDIVLSHGGFLGLGEKKVGFDYNKLMQRSASGDFVMDVSQQTMETSPSFHYEQTNEANTRVMPDTHVRVSELLDSDVTNNRGEVIATADNIHLQDGQARHLIVSYDDVMGMGGELAALNYDELLLLQDEEGYAFGLSADQTARFEEYKNQRERY